MNKNEEILEEIRRQAFIQADQKRRGEEIRQDTRYTLEALQELTGLPRRELQAIAATVSATCGQEEEDFFSIKNQFLMVSAGLGLSCMFVWAVFRLLV
jgi:hypothetical protein